MTHQRPNPLALRRQAPFTPAAALLSVLAAATVPVASQAPEVRSLYAVRLAVPGVIDRLDNHPDTPDRATPSRRQRELRQLLRSAKSTADPSHPALRAREAVVQEVGTIFTELSDLLRAEGDATPELQARLTFTATRPGRVVVLTEGQAEALSTHPLVVSVVADRRLPGTTENGPAWISADDVWSGAATGVDTRGEGILVGVIDSGVQGEHLSFSDTPVDGHTFVNPFGSGIFAGWCDPLDPNFDSSFPCNDKLVGAWDYMDAVCAESPSDPCEEDDGPADQDGHGTNVASIAVGNGVQLSSSSVIISGVAPHANLISYDTCTLGTDFQPSCSLVAIQAAIDQAILDGVDVINMSILSGTDPWSPGDANRDFLDAVDAGIFVALGAGNDGPGAATVAQRGPWLNAVGMSTHDREKYSTTIDFSGGMTSLGPFVVGSFNSSAYPSPAGLVDIVRGADFGAGDAAAQLCGINFPTPGPNPFAPGTWSGEIVICDFNGGGASSPASMKSAFVEAAGGGGLVISNPGGIGDPLVGDSTVVPSVRLTQAQTTALLDWLSQGTGHQARINAATRSDLSLLADRMVEQSSRGPNPSFDVVKPDLLAPGGSIRIESGDPEDVIISTGILAANSPSVLEPVLDPPYAGVLSAFRTGTSMAAPHVAGAAALLRVLEPAWTPDQIRSALTTTAVTAGLTQQDGATAATALDRGAGRIDVATAANAVLLLHETTSNYLAADPAMGGEPATLNLPSMMSSACSGTCSWQRTVTNTGASTESWDVALEGPAGLVLQLTGPFSLAAGASRELDVTLFVTDGGLISDWQDAFLVLTPNDGALPTQRLPILILPTATQTDQLFADGFESGNTTSWSTSVP